MSSSPSLRVIHAPVARGILFSYIDFHVQAKQQPTYTRPEVSSRYFGKRTCDARYDCLRSFEKSVCKTHNSKRVLHLFHVSNEHSTVRNDR